MNPTHFFITCLARSGSTYLRHLLDSHPNITCHGEVLQPVGYLDQLIKRQKKISTTTAYQHWASMLSQLDEVDFIKEILRHDQIETHRTGIKLKVDELYLRQFKNILAYLIQDKNMRVIHLVRTNLLEQYVSKKVSVITGITQQRQVVDKRSVTPMDLDLKKLGRYINWALDAERQVSSDFDDHEMLKISYEALLTNEEQTQQDLLAFLGVPYTPLSSPTLKIINDHRRLINNYQEVLDWSDANNYQNRVF